MPFRAGPHYISQRPAGSFGPSASLRFPPWRRSNRLRCRSCSRCSTAGSSRTAPTAAGSATAAVSGGTGLHRAGRGEASAGLRPRTGGVRVPPQPPQPTPHPRSGEELLPAAGVLLHAAGRCVRAVPVVRQPAGAGEGAAEDQPVQDRHRRRIFASRASPPSPAPELPGGCGRTTG